MLGAAEEIYRLLLERRRRKWQNRPAAEIAGCKIISVGNITVGGTGKTPTVQWLARRLQTDGAKVGIVARGYGGKLSAAGAIVSDGENLLLKAHEAGDEPLLHARSLPGIPVLIGRDRVQTARRAVREFGVDTVVLDDAFQFWSLQRDLDLVLLDARRPFDNGHLLPRGRLRELPQSLTRADAILLTRADAATPDELMATRQLVARYAKAPVFESRHAPMFLRDERSGATLALDSLRSKHVIAVSALADNTNFAATLQNCGATIGQHIQRRDHFRWSAGEVQRVLQNAQRAGAAVVTTEKDAVKWQASWLEQSVEVQRIAVWSLCIALEFQSDETAFYRWFRAALSASH